MLKDRLEDPNFTVGGLIKEICIRTNLTLLEAEWLATLISRRYIGWIKDIEVVIRGS